MPNIFIYVASDPLDLISEGKAMRRLVAPKITMRAPCGHVEAQIKQTNKERLENPKPHKCYHIMR